MVIRPLALLLAAVAPAAATEIAAYTVSARDGDFELRDYPALALVRTESGEGDFMRLFRYISGGNKAGQKIAMTAPVLVGHEGEKKGMSFVMPEKVAATGEVPAPEDPAVVKDSLPAGQFAVYRYSGGRSEANEQEALAKLRAWVGARRLEATGEPLFAYYDPPWIPPFLRRNEVMLRIAATQP